jgi:DNA-binding MarR family transcriptional regulator
MDEAEPKTEQVLAPPHSDTMALIELLFFAYRDFTGDADRVLENFGGFGRAHHRVLHFVRRRPGLRVADLLAILKITKQSLARVLRQLVEEGFVEQREGTDRRERLLYVTPTGAALADRLAAPQIARVEAARRAAGGGGAAIELFLEAMIDDPSEIPRKTGGADR